MRAPLTLALVVAVSGCASAPPPGESAPGPAGEVLLVPSEAVDALEVERSGRTISGTYSEETPRPPAVAATWAFTASGGFSRQMEIGATRVLRRDAGSYTIDTKGRLVLFVEQRGDERFGTAEPLVFELEGDPASALMVRSSEGWSARLVRLGGEPASGDATSAAR